MYRKIKDLLKIYKSILKGKNFETYTLDVEVLLMYATGFNKIKLYTDTDYELSLKEFEKFKNAFERRLKNEPISYIIGKCEFMGLEFFLNKDTLIARADTEILVEKAIEIIKKNNLKFILDIGTGSGAIAISLAKYCENTTICALDINANAILKAIENAKLNQVYERINFSQSDLFENIPQNAIFEMIVSNPPYIRTDDIYNLEDNVKEYEPIIALDGGKSGVEFYEKITENAYKYLKNGGFLIFEIGFDQANDVKNIMIKNNFEEIEILNDLAGLNRVIYGRLVHR